DTRPFPDRDPDNPQGRFVGANDGGSGVAAMMELSHHLGKLPADVGVDVVLFDGEELVYRERRDSYFLGSSHFANVYAAERPAAPYRAGILLDMIGDRELRIYYERNSWNYARDLCKSVFETADSLGVDAFVARVRHEVRDDHLPLNEIAKIPTIDLIDFDYPRPGIGVQQYWHTTKDTPENCSGHSIATVVYVVHQWLIKQ
ncbi:MAG: M28 family peptidase, partial [Planctomycetaceae bacterium]